MRRTTIDLPDHLKEAIERMAGEQGTSEAEVIRAARRNMIVRRQRPRPRVPLLATALADPALAERADELLEGFGRD